jgi:hypothetical protein
VTEGTVTEDAIIKKGSKGTACANDVAKATTASCMFMCIAFYATQIKALPSFFM